MTLADQHTGEAAARRGTSPGTGTQPERSSQLDGPVVVGVDGSECSKAALAWAAGYARLTRRQLAVVIAWHYPPEYGWVLPLPSDWDPRTDALATIEAEVGAVLGDDGRDVTISVVDGPAGPALTEASKTASLLVVASRGRGQLAGVLLGSVSEYMVAHAHCPVVVVRGRNDDADGRDPASNLTGEPAGRPRATTSAGQRDGAPGD